MALTEAQKIEELRRNNDALNRGEFDEGEVARVESFTPEEEEAARGALLG